MKVWWVWLRCHRQGRAAGGVAFRAAGVSLLELTVCLAIVGLLVQTAAPAWVRWRQSQQLLSACGAIATQVAVLQARASAHGRHFGLQFYTVDGLEWHELEDGDGDGLRSDDLRRNIDRPTGRVFRLERDFPGIVAGLPAGVPSLAGARPADGVAFGRLDRLSVAPEGSTSSGTVYLHNAYGDAAAVRLYGATGRVAVWRFRAATSGWERVR